MAHDVTSFFISQSQQKTHTQDTLVRKFLIGTSDYSDYVLGWPSFNRKWNEVRPATITMGLANDDATFNFFRTDHTNLKSTCKIQMGFTHPTSGDELIDIFEGEVVGVKYSDARANVSVSDRFKQMTERVLGTKETPLDFTGSNYLLTDLAWFICTSHSGLSAIESTSNPDIDYETFDAWAGNLSSSDNVLCQAYFDGLKSNQALRKIARMSDSAIYIHGNKIAFSRFTVVASEITSLDNDSVKDMTLSVAQQDVINSMIVHGGYDVTSRQYTFTVTETDSVSVDSFGLHEEFEEDTNVWYVDSASALNYAQRVINLKAVPFDNLSTTGPLNTIMRQIGEMFSMQDDLLGLSDTYRILEQNINVGAGAIELTGNQTQFSNAFTLDVSTLDGSDILA